MNQAFEHMILGTYAQLCIEWRQEISSFRSNARDVNIKLTSLEHVIREFELGVPGLLRGEPDGEIPVPTVAEYEVREAPRASSEDIAQARKAELEPDEGSSVGRLACAT